jgi:hypothetical protein
MIVPDPDDFELQQWMTLSHHVIYAWYREVYLKLEEAKDIIEALRDQQAMPDEKLDKRIEELSK